MSKKISVKETFETSSIKAVLRSSKRAINQLTKNTFPSQRFTSSSNVFIAASMTELHETVAFHETAALLETAIIPFFPSWHFPSNKITTLPIPARMGNLLTETFESHSPSKLLKIK